MEKSKEITAIEEDWEKFEDNLDTKINPEEVANILSKLKCEGVYQNE
jgi:hypothetical protein